MTPRTRKRLKIWGMGLKLAASCVGFVLYALGVCLAAALLCLIVIAMILMFQHNAQDWLRARGWFP